MEIPNSEDFSIPSDTLSDLNDFLPDDIITSTAEKDEGNEFITFYQSFKTYFSLETKYTKYKKAYKNYSCIYKNGQFNISYKIKDKNYYVKFNMATIKSCKNKQTMFMKFFKFNKEAKEKEQAFEKKPDILYYEMQFYLFRAVLAKYLFDVYVNEDIEVLTINMNLLTLLEDEYFVELIKKMEVDNKQNFYGLI